jgi:hypothetical protein
MRHWISGLGVFLTTMSAASFLTVLAIELSGRNLGNYVGIISYLILPVFFILGLVLIPVGLFRLRALERKGVVRGFPVVDFNDANVRTVGVVLAVVTVVNLMLVSTATFKGLEVMHTDAFCGGACHSVMGPEDTAHRVTSHANVLCVDCHIGEGAQHFVTAKLRGASQLLQLLTGRVDRPAHQPTEVASEICTRCHAAGRWGEDRVHIRKLFSADEKAALTTTVWRANPGGQRDGKWHGAHAHLAMEVRFLADAKRATIVEVERKHEDGHVETFKAKDVPVPEGATWRVMGCTDCHNRPAHRFFMPETVVERALGRGAIDRELPFIVKASLEALKADYPSHEAALGGIPKALTAFYAKQLPTQTEEQQKAITAAGALLATEWTHNVFPEMKVGWGTYVDYFQHEPGCFRCHDKNHENPKGEAISKKCSGLCHEVITSEDADPEVVELLYP